jgi:hypothetical protein
MAEQTGIPYPRGVTVLVTGGRSNTDREPLWSTLDSIHRGPRGPIRLLVHGAARGIDTTAARWAKARNVSVHPMPADLRYGPAVGQFRNQAMVEFVLAQPGDRLCVWARGGTGTHDCIDRARAAGIELWEARV